MVTGTADYAVFGAARSTTGKASTFGYTGEQHDPSTGLTYLRARSYDPGRGRFLSADTVQPNAPGTQGYNRYAYTANNPTTWTDPSGHIATNTAYMFQQQMSAQVGQVVRLGLILGMLAPLLPPPFDLLLLPFIFKLLLAVVGILTNRHIDLYLA